MPKYALLAAMLGVAIGLGIGSARTSSRQTADSAGVLPAEQVRARAHAILRGADPLRRVADLGALLPRLGSDAVSELVAAFDASPIEAGEPECVLLGAWWARFDPEAAYQWATWDPNAHNASVVAAIFRGWAHTDPHAALSRTAALKSPALSQIAQDAALAGWDESGKPGLEERIEKLPLSEQQKIGEILARRRIVSLGPEGAFRWLEGLENRQFRELMSSRIASAAASVAGGAPLAAAWAQPRILEGTDTGLPRRIGTRWILHDPIGAMAWLATLPDGADRDDGVAESFRDWLERDGSAAAAWIEHAPLERWNEPAMIVYVKGLAGTNPKEAMELASRLSTRSRESAMISVGQIWAGKDREAAAAWIAQSDLSEPARKTALLAARRPRLEQMKKVAEAQARAEAEQAQARAEAEKKAAKASP